MLNCAILQNDKTISETCHSEEASRKISCHEFLIMQHGNFSAVKQ